MWVLYFYKIYLSEMVGGIEQVIFQFCESSGVWGIDNYVLILSSDLYLFVVFFGGYVVYCVRFDLQFVFIGFFLSVFKQFCELVVEVDVVNYYFFWLFMDLVYFFIGMNKLSVVIYYLDIICQCVLLKLYWLLMGCFFYSVDWIVVVLFNYFSISDVFCQYWEKIWVIIYGLDKVCYLKFVVQCLEYW